MSGVMKKANLGVRQHRIGACTLSQLAESREKNNEGGIPNRKR